MKLRIHSYQCVHNIHLITGIIEDGYVLLQHRYYLHHNGLYTPIMVVGMNIAVQAPFVQLRIAPMRQYPDICALIQNGDILTDIDGEHPNL